jgi:crotonobetainyl-CoA:carnitine CoA-transferase CaiB-like acyl-CoA transferase
MDAFLNRDDILPKGNGDDHIPAAPHGCYRCSGEDRWCVIAVFGEEQWRALCNVLGNPAWTKEEKFSSLPKRRANKTELDALLEPWTEKHPAHELVKRLQAAGVPAGLVQNAEDVAHDPQLRARDFFTSLVHPILGETKTDACPIKFDNYRIGPWKASPLLGEGNRYVYGELLNLSEKTIRSYMDRGVIA